MGADHLDVAWHLQATIAELEDSARKLRSTRDDAIRAALRGGLSAYRVAKTLGLDARQVRNIRDAESDADNTSTA